MESAPRIEELLPEQLAKAPWTLPAVWLDAKQRIRFKMSGQTSEVTDMLDSRREGKMLSTDFVEPLPWECSVRLEEAPLCEKWSIRQVRPVSLFLAPFPLAHQRLH